MAFGELHVCGIYSRDLSEWGSMIDCVDGVLVILKIPFILSPSVCNFTSIIKTTETLSGSEIVGEPWWRNLNE